MYDGEISEGQKKDMEKSFYAGAMAINLAVIKGADSENPEKHIAELFDFITQKCEALAKEKQMYNKLIVIGNLTRDIELRYLPSGAAIAKSAIATSYKYKTSTGESKDEVMFLDFNMFGRSGEVANQYLRKGSKVMLEGRLVLEQWTGQDGANRSKHSLRVDVMKMLDSKQDGQNHQQGHQQQNYRQETPEANSQHEHNNVNHQQNQQQQKVQEQKIPEIDIEEDEIPF